LKRVRLVIFFVFLGASCLFFICSGAWGQENRAIQLKLDRLEQLTKLPASEWRVHEGDVLGAEDENFDDSSWRSVSPEFHWTSGSAWFRRTIEVPASLNGYDLTGATIYFEFQVWGSDYPLTIYANGSRVAMGEDLEPILLFRNARPKQKITIAVKAPSPPGSESTFHQVDLMVRAAGTRPDPGVIRVEILADQAMLRSIAEDQAANLRRIDSAIAAINTDALDRGDQAAFDASLRNAQAELEPLRSMLGKYTIHATGNAHIDMAWLWPWTETVEVVRNTFNTSLQLMDEYPEYTFTQSTAQASEWLEEKYPQLFERIKKRVQEGRWELVGGMWVEPDLNMPASRWFGNYSSAKVTSRKNSARTSASDGTPIRLDTTGSCRRFTRNRAWISL
jgi:alpha-mannosidase